MMAIRRIDRPMVLMKFRMCQRKRDEMMFCYSSRGFCGYDCRRSFVERPSYVGSGSVLGPTYARTNGILLIDRALARWRYTRARSQVLGIEARKSEMRNAGYLKI